MRGKDTMRLKKSILILITLLSIISTGSSTWAEDFQADKKEANRLLRGNEPSYFVHARDKDDNSEHIEFYLSVKYPMMDWLFSENASLFFNYNGKYDFFVSTRHSSPIISRIQNPGLMYEYKLEEPAWRLKSIKTGYFHESNGQTIDSKAEYLLAEYAEDYVSRGWDYIPLDLKFEPSNNFSFYLKLRYFLEMQMGKYEKEDKIFWEPVAGDQSEIEDYDGIRMLFSKKFKVKYFDEIKLAAMFRSGYRDYNLSQRYEGTFKIGGIPFHAFYVTGYGNEIATYHKKGYYYGIGLEMW